MQTKPYEVILLGATGFTGRQAVRALVHRAGSRPLRWAVAGRNAEKLSELVAELVPKGTPQPGVVLADTGDPDSLQALAAQGDVLLNLAGPYAPTGEAVVLACIANGTHYLDLTGETFWVRQLVERHHAAAQRAKVKIIPCAGFEALPFDVATLWAATQVRERFGQACREVKLIVQFSGKRLKSFKDVVSGGTVASMKTMLEFDTTDCVRNPGCLLPAGTRDAAGIAARNAYRFLPQYDADLQSVIAPTIPAPFCNPPIVLRSVALIDDATLFTPHFVYREGTDVTSLLPKVPLLPRAATLPLQWATAATIAAPLANLSATMNGPLEFTRGALAKLIDRFAPKSGQGPREEVLSGTGYAFEVFATSADGRHKLHGRMQAQGHPGYRSTPEMVASAAVGLARGELGRTPHFGVVTPASGLGIETVAALTDAGVNFSLLE